MTTTVEKNQENTAKISWGAHFRTTREGMNLTEKDIATRLHLNPNIIAIIESETFDNGPPAIFMRGYIRSYCRILNQSEKQIKQALTDLGLSEETTSKAAPALRHRKVAEPSSGYGFTSWSTSVVVLVLVGLVGMWWNSHSRNNSADASANASAALALQNSPNLTTSATPGDPTPKELANSTPAPAQPATPEANPNAIAQQTTNPAATAAINPTVANNTPNSQTPPAPGAEPVQTQAAVASANNPAAPAQATTAETPTAPETSNPIASNEAATPPAIAPTPGAEGNTGPTNPALAENATGDDNADDDTPAPPKKHLRHHRHPDPDIAQEEMALPEPGLVPEDGTPSDN